MIEAIFLLVLAGIFVTAGSIEDIKKREVENWISFSLIIFALGFRLFWSLFNGDSFVSFNNLFYQGVIGLIIFAIIGHLFYYGRVFAGGDAKLMIALGAILPLSYSFKENFYGYALFLFLFLMVGSVYGLIWSFVLVLRNKKSFAKEFRKNIKKNMRIIIIIYIISALLLIFGIHFRILFSFGVLFAIYPLVLIYARSVDEACMIKKVSTNKLVEGDWLYKNVILRKGNKRVGLIKSTWEGLSNKEIELLRKKMKFVDLREGIPFVPVFFFTLIIFAWMYFNDKIIILF